MRPLRTCALLLVCALVLASCTTEPIREGEQNLVLTVGELRDYGLDLPSNYAQYETFKRERWFDGSVMIEYTFEAPEELELPFVFAVAERHPSKSDACLSFSAGNLGVRLGGGDVEERNDLFQFGDKSRFGFLKVDGEVRGNVFSMCDGKTALMVMLGGFYFDDGEAWAEAIEPTLLAIRSQN